MTQHGARLCSFVQRPSVQINECFIMRWESPAGIEAARGPNSQGSTRMVIVDFFCSEKVLTPSGRRCGQQHLGEHRSCGVLQHNQQSALTASLLSNPNLEALNALKYAISLWRACWKHFDRRDSQRSLRQMASRQTVVTSILTAANDSCAVLVEHSGDADFCCLDLVKRDQWRVIGLQEIPL